MNGTATSLELVLYSPSLATRATLPPAYRQSLQSTFDSLFSALVSIKFLRVLSITSMSCFCRMIRSFSFPTLLSVQAKAASCASPQAHVLSRAALVLLSKNYHASKFMVGSSPDSEGVRRGCKRGRSGMRQTTRNGREGGTVRRRLANLVLHVWDFV